MKITSEVILFLIVTGVFASFGRVVKEYFENTFDKNNLDSSKN